MHADPIPTVEWDHRVRNVAEIKSALQTYSVVRLANAIDPYIAERAFDLASSLFALSEEERMACRREGDGSGYTPPGIEYVRGMPDGLRTFWDVRRPDLFPNVFPKGRDDIRWGIESFLFLLKNLGTRVPGAMRPSFVEDMVPGEHHLRCSHYQDVPVGKITMEAHRDFGLLTVYVGGGGKGLEVHVKDQWVDAESTFGDIIIGIGSCWTLYDKRLKPLWHRVVGTGELRTSMVVFLELGPDVILPTGERNRDRMIRLMKNVLPSAY